MTTAMAEPEVAEAATGDGITHFTCCDKEIALCGAQTIREADTETDVDCMFCLYLENDPCSSTCQYGAQGG